jgi:6,7-dimethyl-8-ribityllumazine synthase
MKKNIQKQRIAIVFSEFNKEIGEKLLKKTVNELKKNKIIAVDIFKVPGALEIPIVCKKIIIRKKYDIIIALGVVIKGETSHYEHVSRESIHNIQKLAVENSFPIITGILTVLTERQAIERIDNGIYYAKSSIALLNILKSI